MRTYLSALLSFVFFLLLVDTSLSISLRPVTAIRKPLINFSPKITIRLPKQEPSKIFEKAWDFLTKHNPSAPPQPDLVEGLSRIKEYFSRFGYYTNPGPLTDYLDNDTITAIENYQQFFNLKVTGLLDNETQQHISFPRCGVPDVNFDYNLTSSSNVSWPKGNQWFPNGTKKLTYGFLPESEIPVIATNVFRDAFNRWSQAVKVLNLTETTSFEDADIKVGFYHFYGSSFQELLVGDVVILLQPPAAGSNNVVKIVGEMRLDGTKSWALPSVNDTSSWPDGLIDLETVAMHQIGHLLGLNHSSVEEAVMYPSILPSQKRKVQLANDDIKRIQQLYPTSNGTNATVGV